LALPRNKFCGNQRGIHRTGINSLERFAEVKTRFLVK